MAEDKKYSLVKQFTEFETKKEAMKEWKKAVFDHPEWIVWDKKMKEHIEDFYDNRDDLIFEEKWENYKLNQFKTREEYENSPIYKILKSFNNIYIFQMLYDVLFLEKHKCFYKIYGNSSYGKTWFLEWLKRELNYVGFTKFFEKNIGETCLHKKVIVCDDCNEHWDSFVNFIKQLTGNKQFSPDIKYNNIREIDTPIVLIFCSNNYLSLKEESGVKYLEYKTKDLFMGEMQPSETTYKIKDLGLINRARIIEWSIDCSRVNWDIIELYKVINWWKKEYDNSIDIETD